MDFWRPIVFGMISYDKAREISDMETFIKMNLAIDHFYPPLKN